MPAPRQWRPGRGGWYAHAQCTNVRENTRSSRSSSPLAAASAPFRPSSSAGASPASARAASSSRPATSPAPARSTPSTATTAAAWPTPSPGGSPSRSPSTGWSAARVGPPSAAALRAAYPCLITPSPGFILGHRLSTARSSHARSYPRKGNGRAGGGQVTKLRKPLGRQATSVSL